MSSIRQHGARVLIAGMALAALGSLVLATAHWNANDPVKFACYMAAALLASPLKVSLPSGTLSVNFLFTLLGILELGLPETLLIGLISTLGQFYWRPARRLQLIQLLFNLSQVTVSAQPPTVHTDSSAFMCCTGPGRSRCWWPRSRILRSIRWLLQPLLD